MTNKEKFRGLVERCAGYYVISYYNIEISKGNLRSLVTSLGHAPRARITRARKEERRMKE